jgi:P-type Cu+ transporter
VNQSLRGDALFVMAVDSTPPVPSKAACRTSILLSNLHCPSCVSNIEKTVLALHPQPLSVSSSIVTSWVTVIHRPSLLSMAIEKSLEISGFDVCSIRADNISQQTLDDDTREVASHSSQGILIERDNGSLDQTPGNEGSKGDRVKKMAKHIQLCDLCQAEELQTQEKKPSPSSPPLVPCECPKEDPKIGSLEKEGDLTRACCLDDDAQKTCPPHSRPSSGPCGAVSPSGLPFVVVDKGADSDSWRASLAIGGMTCASCVNAIKDGLEKKDWVRRVTINLIAQSGTVEFVGKDHAEDIAMAVEDLGYEAALQDVQSTIQPKNKTSLKGVFSPSQRRTIEIKVAGMFCPQCPSRLIKSLDAFGERVVIEKPLSLSDPILRISYTPDAPYFTIRDIIKTLSAVDPTLVPSIYLPQTLEEKSRILHARERRRMLRRVMLTAATAIPTFIIGVLFTSPIPPTNRDRQYLSSPWIAGVSRTQWALFIMATPVYFFAADIFHRRSLKEISVMWRPGSKVPFLQRFYRFGSMNMLMSLGTSIAYFSSVAQLIAAGANQAVMVNDGAFYFDSVVFLTLFLLVGRLIESYSKSRTGDAVAMLGKLRPTEAILVENTKDMESHLSNVSVDLVEFGDTGRVLQGASPPYDGTVIDGETVFDESSLTGESKLIKKVPNDQVYAGTINRGPPISIQITGVGGSSMIDGIVQAVRDGQTRPAPIERIADTLTAYFVPFVTMLALLTWIIWLSLGVSGALPEDYLSSNSGGWIAWSLQFAIAVFVVACPCGLGLAAPTALYVGGGLAAHHGILVKGGGEAFEKASRLGCVVFDKTGTLTLGGEPVVTDYKTLQQWSENKILSMVQRLEENSNHTIAKAIISFCKSRDLEKSDIMDIEEIPGKGMKGVVLEGSIGKNILLVGNEALMDDYCIHVPDEVVATLSEWKTEGKSVALVATKSTKGEHLSCVAAIFGISDAIRPEAPGVVKALQRRGFAVWMLSGDNYSTASAIGAQVGIPSSNIIAGVLPNEKAEKIQFLQKSVKAPSRGGREVTSRRALVAMVGDGINDSPALATADVGIAIGSGSDIAISAAEFVLVSSNLHSILTLLHLSVIVFRRVKFNFAWALVYNMIGVPVAAGVLYPIVSNGGHVRLDPVWASLAMALSSISVVCSSLMLRSRIPGLGFRSPKWQ